MVRYTRLTIDIRRELLVTQFVPASGRVSNFANRAFMERQGTRLFLPEVDQDAGRLLVSLSADGLHLELGELKGRLYVGDRLLLLADRDGESNYFRVVDGSAEFVLHVLDRADVFIINRLSDLVLPNGTALAGTSEERSKWIIARNMVLEVMVESIIRGPLAMSGLERQVSSQGKILAFTGEGGKHVSARELIQLPIHHQLETSVRNLFEEAEATFDDIQLRELRAQFERNVAAIKRGEALPRARVG